MPSLIRKYHPDGTLPFGFELWVFGSNMRGIHGASAAKVAYDRFGAAWGIAEGLMGQSYAIPTKGFDLRVPMSLQEIGIYVQRFVDFTKANTGDEFWVTSVGCGLSRYKDHQIAPMFKAARNCNFPLNWRDWLEDIDISPSFPRQWKLLEDERPLIDRNLI